MQIVIFADAPLGDADTLQTTPAAALAEVCGRPVIDYVLDELADAQAQEVTVFVGPDATALREHLGQGEAWGLSLKVLSSRGEEAPSALLRRASLDWTAPVVGIRGDVFHRPCYAPFQQDAAQDDVLGFGLRGQVLLVRSRVADDFDNLQRPLSQLELRAGLRALSLSACPSWAIRSLADLYAANAAMLAGVREPDHLLKSEQLWLGQRTLAHCASVDSGRASIGDHGRVHSTARLRGWVSLGRGAFVDRQTRLQDCVVLPGTYVGAGLEFRQCVIGPQGVLQLPSGRTLAISEPLWLRPTHASAQTPRRPWLDWWVAQCLLLLSYLLPSLALQRDELRAVRAGEKQWLGPSQRSHRLGSTQGIGREPAQAVLPGLVSVGELLLTADAPPEEWWLTDVMHQNLQGWARLRWLPAAIWHWLKQSMTSHTSAGEWA